MSTAPSMSGPSPSLLPPTLLVLLSSAVLRLLFTGEVNVFVGPLVRPLLWVAVAIITMLATAQLWDGLAGRAVHGHGSRLGVLALLPVLVAGFLGCHSLGAWSASRQSAGLSAVQDQNFGGPPPGGWPALAPGRVAMGTYEYVQRANEEGTSSLSGHEVVMDGFVTRTAGGGWALTRMKVFCCAADAMPFSVVADGHPLPADEGWVRVVAIPAPNDADGESHMVVQSVEPIIAPKDPYQW